jgi:Tol biopolymer transport system component
VRSTASALALAAAALAAPAGTALAAPGELHLASATATGAASNGEALVPSVSGDGTLVAFFSTATNLHPADTDAGPDVYVKNVRTGEVILASRAAGGAKGNGDSRLAALSADGSRVGFVSEATNLHPAGVPGVYVKDLATGAVQLASTTQTGTPANAGASAVVLSDDGRRVAFATTATNLDPRDPVDDFDVYVKDLDSGQLTLASLSATGEKRFGLFGSGAPDMSADGNRVAFSSDAVGLHPADGDQTGDVFVRDLRTGQLLLASTSDAGAKGNGQSSAPSLSADGTKVSFVSYATNLDPAMTVNGLNAIYLKDLASGELSLASRNAAGSLILGGVSAPFMSADATRIAFDSPSWNAHPADADRVADVFVKDLATGHVFLASASTAGVKGNGDSYPAVLSADGSMAAFRTNATNLAAADIDSASDVYAKELADAPPSPADRADLAITQTDSPDPVLAGQRLAYDLRVGNDGPATATGVVALEELDVGVRLESAAASRGSCAESADGVRCELGALAPGETATIAVRVTPTTQGTIAARATVQSDQSDADALDNTSRVLTRVDPAADLAMSVTDSPDPARARSRLTYRAEVANAGPSTAGTATITVTVPDAVRLLSVSAPGAFCPDTSGVVRCSFFGVEPGQRVAVTIETVPRRTGTLTASATVSSPDTADPVPANNRDTESTAVIR